MKKLIYLALALALSNTVNGQETSDGDEDAARGGTIVESRVGGGRVVGVGENLGRDKKASVLNYVLYGGRTYQADGRPTLVLHKIERPKTGLLGSDSAARNPFIISYQYVEPKVIYLQGAWMEILEFDNTHLRFKVLDRKPIGAPE